MFQTIRRRLYPRVVPQSVTTADVERQIADAWRSECAAWGVKYFEPPGWDTVNRKLGRGP
jgi:hypothetical protein